MPSLGEMRARATLVTTKGAGGFGGRDSGGPLARTTSGLLVFDDFKEPGTGEEPLGGEWDVIINDSEATGDGNPVIDRDNDWVESNATGNNQTETILINDPADNFDGMIVQATLRSTQANDSGIPALMLHHNGLDDPNTDAYLFQLRHAQGFFILDVVDSAVDSESSTGSDASLAPNEDYSFRGVSERSGSDTLLRLYAVGGDPPTNVSAPNDDPNKGDLTLVLSHTDVGGQLDGGYYGIHGHDDWRGYFFLACGRNVQVTGLPSGYKAQLDDGTAVVESGGTATIDVDAVGLPAQTIKVLDGDDVEQASLTPNAITGRQGDAYSGGIVGGDIFAFSE